MLFDLTGTTRSDVQRPYRILPFRDYLRQDGAPVMLLAAIGFLVEFLVNPSGEFPLNDDWSYTLSLQHLYENHHLVLGGWTSMPLMIQLYWGLLFCKIFGFSFTVLRYSTIVLGLAGVIGSYFLMKEFSVNRKVCLFAALIVLLNPIYLNLSNTFMTDVPFTSLLIFAILFFVRACKTDRTRYILLGLVFAVLATLIRQLGLLVVGAFSIAWLVKGGLERRTLLISFFSSALPLGIYLGYNHWIRAEGHYPVKYDEGVRRILYTLFSSDHSTVRLLFRQGLTVLVYCGCFIFPFLFILDWRAIWRERRTRVIISGILTIVAGIYCIYKPVLPLMGNIMNIYGLGPVSMRDVSILQSSNLQPVSPLIWQLLSLAGIIGAGALFLIPRRIGTRRPAIVFLYCFAALYTGVMLVGGTYDRYLLPLLPVLAVLLLSSLSPATPRESERKAPERLKLILASLVLLPYAFFSTAGTADYLSWNRARWNAIHFLTQDKGIKPQQIDAGFEFNGYYLYNDKDITELKQRSDPMQRSWWWVQDDSYLIAFGPVRGYTSVRAYPYKRILSPSSSGGDKIYILEKTK